MRGRLVISPALWQAHFLAQSDSNGPALLIGLFFAAMPLILAAITTYKLLQVRAAAGWSTATGRITWVGTKVQRQRRSGQATIVTSKPAARYEFKVGDEAFEGDSLSLGETPGTAGLDGTFPRYKVGAEVEVYYDPARPTRCTLDRSYPVPPKAAWTFVAVLVLLAAAIMAAAAYSSLFFELLQRWFPDAAHGFGTLFFAAGGLLILASSWSYQRQAKATVQWPVVIGRIASSEVESFRERVGSARSGTRTTLYKAVIEYVYVVDGLEYHASRIAIGPYVATGSQARAAAQVAKYPVESAVEVHYDPQNPANAVLDVAYRQQWLALLLAVGFFAAALFFAGVFSRAH